MIGVPWLIGGMVGAGTRGSFSRESSVTRPTNPDEEDMDGVYRLLDHETWWKPMAISNGVVVVDCKLPASWKETSTWQGFTWRTEVGCRCSGVTSSLSLASAYWRCFMQREWLTSFFFSLPFSNECLLNRDGTGRSEQIRPGTHSPHQYYHWPAEVWTDFYV